MSDRWDSDWDSEPVGDDHLGKRRRWRRPWNNYVCIVLGFVGVVLLIGAATNGHVAGTVGALCVLVATYAVSRGDGPRHTATRPWRPPPTLAVELGWYAAALVLVVVAVVLTTL